MASNLLAQDFRTDAPGKVWLTDITYVRTDEGWLYLAGVKDLFTQVIVGYAMSARMTQDLTLDALNRAVRHARPRAGLLHHSDRGSQYCASRYRKRLDALGMRVSMSRRDHRVDRSVLQPSAPAQCAGLPAAGGFPAGFLSKDFTVKETVYG